MLYRHWRDYLGDWYWPNFSPVELSCKHCGEYYHCDRTIDALQNVRDTIGRAMVISSAHRCVTHNKNVGGAKASQHLKLAIDIQAAGHDRAKLVAACKAAGFSGFGFYNTFLHVDMGPIRVWGDQSKWR
jgi:uncharacterized protein YcbK (DUF882 family)